MSDIAVDRSKRTWLIASGCAGAVGGIATAVPFVSTFQPSERAKAAGAAVEVDISALKPGEKVTVEVRINLTGEVGDRDSLVDQQLMTLTVEAEATHIPDHFDVSIAGARVGDNVTAGQVELPEGTTLIGDPEQVVVAVQATQTAEQLDAELADAEAEAGIERDEPTGPADEAETPSE